MRVQASTDSILVCWSEIGPSVDSVLVEWSASSGQTRTATVTDGSSSYTITGLEEGTRYTVGVTASNTAGSSSAASVIAFTQTEMDGAVCPEVTSVVTTVTATVVNVVTSTVSAVPPTPTCPVTMPQTGIYIVTCRQ